MYNQSNIIRESIFAKIDCQANCAHILWAWILRKVILLSTHNQCHIFFSKVSRLIDQVFLNWEISWKLCIPKWEVKWSTFIAKSYEAKNPFDLIDQSLIITGIWRFLISFSILWFLLIQFKLKHCNKCINRLDYKIIILENDSKKLQNKQYQKESFLMNHPKQTHHTCILTLSTKTFMKFIQTFSFKYFLFEELLTLFVRSFFMLTSSAAVSTLRL